MQFVVLAAATADASNNSPVGKATTNLRTGARVVLLGHTRHYFAFKCY